MAGPKKVLAGVGAPDFANCAFVNSTRVKLLLVTQRWPEELNIKAEAVLG